VRRQCALLGLNRSNLYYAPADEDGFSLDVMRALDELYMEHPFYGSRRLAVVLQQRGFSVNRKRVQRLMHVMGLEAIYPRPRTSVPNSGHQIYPYLLRNVPIVGSNHVWSTDITYIRLRRGFCYLVAVMDWYSRFVLSWALSNTMDVCFCLDALDDALRQGRPAIFNSDQGAQFTSNDFTGRLRDVGVQISMDGRGRALDNVWIERLWRSVKYEEVYLRDYQTVDDARQGLSRYLAFYNHERPHQSLDYRTPAHVYRDGPRVGTEGLAS